MRDLHTINDRHLQAYLSRDITLDQLAATLTGIEPYHIVGDQVLRHTPDEYRAKIAARTPCRQLHPPLDRDVQAAVVSGRITLHAAWGFQAARNAGEAVHLDAPRLEAPCPDDHTTLATRFAAACAWIALHASTFLQRLLASHRAVLDLPDTQACIRNRRRQEIIWLASAEGCPGLDPTPSPPDDATMQRIQAEPGYIAQAFAAARSAPIDEAAAPTAVDLVVPLGTGSQRDDLELRYLIRSARSHLIGLGRIHVIGPRRPTWLQTDDTLHWHDWTPRTSKSHDIIAKFLYAARNPDVADTFVGTCDDWLFLEDIRPGLDWGAVRGGVLSTRTDTFWLRCQANARAVLEAAGLPAVYYDTHNPSVMTKAGWLAVDRTLAWHSRDAYAVWSLYHNCAGTHGPVLPGTRATGWHAADGNRAPQSLQEIADTVRDKLFLRYNDGGLSTGHLGEWLAIRFPDPDAGLRSPADMRIIQIDITNACPRACSNCTRLSGHHPVPDHMSLAAVAAAVTSLHGYWGMAGIMGGEPTLHPDFAQIVQTAHAARADGVQIPPPHPDRFEPCLDWESRVQRTLGRLRPEDKLGLWTGLGPGYSRHYEAIQDAFRYQCINTHRDGGRHGALLVCRRDLGVPDAEWYALRNRCWLQRQWSASITTHGAYFCEVAGAIDGYLYGGRGWSVEPGWWRRQPHEFGRQLELCEYCGACLPLPTMLDADGIDLVSPTWDRLLDERGSRKPRRAITRTWSELRTAHSPNQSCEPYLAPTKRRTPKHGLAFADSPLHVIVPCVEYDDYLDLTLPRNLRVLSDAAVTVVTTPQDAPTRAVCERHGARCMTTDAFHADGATFAKGRATNAALRQIHEEAPDAWILMLDADIVLPADFAAWRARVVLNPGALYYARRWLLPSRDDIPAALAHFDSGRPFAPTTKHNTKPWGYFQLWSFRSQLQRDRAGDWYPAASHDAGTDDTIFYRRYRDAGRLADSGLRTLHLPHSIEQAQNWKGRVTPRLDQ